MHFPSFRDDLKIGDRCSVVVSRFGRTRVRVVRVQKITKTTITVVGIYEGAKPQIFNLSTGNLRGTSTWNREYLDTYDRYVRTKEQQRIDSLKEEKKAKRERLIKALTDSIETETDFAIALEALNQQEYASNG